jgi:hypothetical protein
MSLLPNGYNPQTLQDTLTQQAQSASANAADAYIQQKKRSVADLAAGGQLMSGVANYPLTDIATQQQRTQSWIQDKLASSLAGIPEEDWLNQQNFNRQKSLAELIGAINKPSTLDEVLSAI